MTNPYDGLAGSWWALYAALKGRGFTNEQAFDLLKLILTLIGANQAAVLPNLVQMLLTPAKPQ